jgi:hypothetical protein
MREDDMTNLTTAEKLAIQKDLERGYEASIQYYRDWAENSRQDPNSAIAVRQADVEAKQVAKIEAFVTQFGEVPLDKLTLAERVGIESHLRKSKDGFIEIYRNNKNGPAIDFAEAEVLLKSFNAVTQRKRAASIPKSAYTPPPVPPFAGCR